MSADGSTVVGACGTPEGDRAFRWTRGGGMEDLGVLSGALGSVAGSVNGDGTVVVGAYGPFSFHNRAFRWTPADGMQDLGLLPGAAGAGASDVSDDGMVVVGTASDPSGSRAFRWTNSRGMEDLGTPPGAESAGAIGVSADGSVIAGSDSRGHVVRWVGDGVIEDLGRPPMTESGIEVFAISGDGLAVAATGYDNSGFLHALRWTVARGWEELPALPNSTGGAAVLDMNLDGSVAVGTATGPAFESFAALWAALGEPVILQDYLQSHGIDVTGWSLWSAEGVSADGLTVVGRGINPDGHEEAWIMTLATCLADFNHDRVINSQDFFDFLTAFFAADPAADFNADGEVDSGDFFAFLDAFFAGCP